MTILMLFVDFVFVTDVTYQAMGASLEFHGSSCRELKRRAWKRIALKKQLG